MSATHRSTDTNAGLRALLRWRRWGSRWRPGSLAVALLAGVLVGAPIGRATAPDPDVVAARSLDRVLELVLDADSIWSSASDDRPPVAEVVVALRRGDDGAFVDDHVHGWLAAYDSILLQVAGVDLPASARGVQRQLLMAVTLARDAVEVLAHAAATGSAVVRRELLVEVGRLRQRSEQLVQAARASVADLHGQRADVAPPGPVPRFGATP